MFLKSLNIKHFRSLYDTNLNLKPITIIIGPNASGKSNLFKALKFLQDGITGDIQDWQAYYGQMDDIMWYGYDEFGARPDTLSFDLSFARSFAHYESGRYSSSITQHDHLHIENESLEIGTGDVGKLQTYFDRRGVQIGLHTGQRGKPYVTPHSLRAKSSRLLHLREEGPSFKLVGARSIYEHIAGWRFFDIDLHRARQASFIPEVPEEIPPLAGDCSNLSAFLYAIVRLSSDENDLMNDLSDKMSNLIDLPQSILVEHDSERGGQNARYHFIEQPFGEGRYVPPESMSDGTIRLLGILSLLLADRSSSLVCLEEPDHGLHPRLMLHLADVLRQAVEEDNGSEQDPSAAAQQVIISTHNAEFMDCFDLDAESDYLQVYVVDRDLHGKTEFVPTTVDEFAPWLERYRLGEAIRRNMI